jgi:two-component system, CitB family, sensor kinase
MDQSTVRASAWPSRKSLASRLFVMQVVVVALTVTTGAAAMLHTASRGQHEQERQRALAVAETFAQSPEVARALRQPDPARLLEPLAEQVRKETGVAFVLVLSSRRESITGSFTGTQGRDAVRVAAPVVSGGRTIGYVSAGVLEEEISALLVQQVPTLLALAGIGLFVGTVLSLLLAAWVKRQTLGLEPRAITKLYQHNNAMLHAIREGVLVVDGEGRLVIANDEAHRLLLLPNDAEGKLLGHSVPQGSLRALLASQRATRDETHLVGDRILIVNQSEAHVDGKLVGVVTTLRDRTELEALLREFDTVRGMAESLRAKAHESANQLQALVGLIELGHYDEAVRFATEEVEIAQDLLHRLQERIHEPALLALLLGKTAVAHERGIELEIAGEEFAAPGLPQVELVTIVGNLIDNAMDAAAGEPSPIVVVSLESGEEWSTVEVRDNGPGIPSSRVFEPGWTTKPANAHGARGLGLALVKQATARVGGTVSARNDGGAVFTVKLPFPAPVSLLPVEAE